MTARAVEERTSGHAFDSDSHFRKLRRGVILPTPRHLLPGCEEHVGGANEGSDYDTRIPRRLLKVSSDYRLPGVLDQWRVGDDVFAQRRTSTSASTYDIRQSGYALLNLHTSYQLNRQLSLQYNLNNALDKTYYQSLPASNNWGAALR